MLNVNMLNISSVLAANFFLFLSGFYFDVSGYKVNLQGFISLYMYISAYGNSELIMSFNKRVHKCRARGGHSY
jgi:hypothetical protein